MEDFVPYQTPTKVCKECGKALEDSVTSCPNCGCPVSNSKSSLPRFNIVRICVAAILIIAALIMVISGSKILNSDDMEFYQEHLQTCKEGRRECQNAMYTSSGMFYGMYRDLVESYDEMIEDDEEEIDKLKDKANGQFILAGLCAVGAAIAFFAAWKRGDEAWH